MNDNEKLIKALRDLVDKIKLIENHPAYQAVWDMALLHGHSYKGPQYGEELDRASDLLEELANKVAADKPIKNCYWFHGHPDSFTDEAKPMVNRTFPCHAEDCKCGMSWEECPHGKLYEPEQPGEEQQ